MGAAAAHTAAIRCAAAAHTAAIMGAAAACVAAIRCVAAAPDNCMYIRRSYVGSRKGNNMALK